MLRVGRAKDLEMFVSKTMRSVRRIMECSKYRMNVCKGKDGGWGRSNVRYDAMAGSVNAPGA